MNNAPQRPGQVVSQWVEDWYDHEYDCMQEAITCEWLIENGLMPDPTDRRSVSGWDFWHVYQHNLDNVAFQEWDFKDCDPDGKPSDYEVQR